MDPIERRLQYVLLVMFVVLMLLGDLIAYYIVKEFFSTLTQSQEIFYFLGISVLVSASLILLTNGLVWIINRISPLSDKE
jgi:hypothetical protein